MFLKIKNPKKPGEFLVLHQDDFRADEHELYVEEDSKSAAAPAPKPEPAAEPKKTAAPAPKGKGGR
jgi:hypothetical protein